MKTRIFPFMLTILLVISSGCEWILDSDDVDPIPITIVPYEEWRAYYENLPKDTVIIVDAAVKGHLLKLDVEYTGSCEEHRFEALAGKSYIETYPAGVDVFLGHGNGGDLCSNEVSKELAFDLRPLKEKYGPSSGFDFNSMRIFVAYDCTWVWFKYPRPHGNGPQESGFRHIGIYEF